MSNETNESMNIITLSIDGFRKILTAVATIQPGTSVVEVRGANGTGKSSFIDALIALLIPFRINAKDKDFETPVNYGADRAKVSMTIGRDGVPFYEIKRTLKKDGTTSGLTITDLRAGAVMRSPQQFIDDLMSLVARNPLMFLERPATEQFEILAKLKKVDLGAFDKKIEDLEERRKAGNAMIRSAEAVSAARAADVAACGVALDVISRGAVDVTSLRLEQGKIQAVCTEKKKSAEAMQRSRDEITRAREAIAKHQAAIKALEDGVAQHEAYLAAMAEIDIDTAAEQAEITGIDKRIEDAAKINAAVEKDRAALAADQDLKKYRKALEVIEGEIRGAREARRKAVAAAPSPVAGLDIDPETRLVTLNGKPLKDASTAETILASVDLAIAENPHLKVLFLKEGSLLDRMSLRAIAERASSAGFQIILESVDQNTTDPNTFEVVGAEITDLQVSKSTPK